ncbi:MAG: Lrp/AsnC family transcriptional regulator [Acidimicrobiales bacterium]
MSTALDPLDQRLVDELVRDGRATFQDLGRTIGLSPTATADRVRRLQKAGVIRGFRAVLDAGHLGRTVEAAIDVRLEPGADRNRFADALRAQPGVVEAVHVTGHYDYMLRVFCTGTAELDGILTDLKERAGVVESQTRLLLHRIADLGGARSALEGSPPALY